MDGEIVTAIAGAAAAVGYVVKELVVRHESKQISRRGSNGGNGKVPMAEVAALLDTHTKICGGRIEQKMDVLSDKLDDHIAEMRVVQREQWQNMAEMQKAITVNAKDVGINAALLKAHVEAKHA